MKNENLKQIVFFVFICCLFSYGLHAQTQRFTLLHTTDEHSNLLSLPLVDYHPEKPHPAVGGFARLSTLTKQIRREKADEPVLLLSSGDFIGGSPFAWLILEGFSPEIEIMKRIGYDATTIGNHEFDYGPDVLAEYLVRSGYPSSHSDLPIIASNLNIPAGHALEKMQMPDNQIFTLSNGLIVGIFGILGDAAYEVAPAAEPIDIFPPIEAARQQVELLGQAGAQVIIALSHSGIKQDRKLAESVDGIDVILGGHDHLQVSTPENINNTIILHSSYYLQKMGQLELAFDPSNGTLHLLNEENQTPYLVSLDSTIEEDPVIAGLIDEYSSQLNAFLASFTDSLFLDFSAAIMYSDFSLVKHSEMEETTVGNFVTDAMRLEAEKVTQKRVDIAFQANGVIRGNIVPGSMEWSKGEVSFLDLVTIAGLGSGPDGRPGYPMVSFYLTEKEIFNVLEIASLLSQLMGDTYFLQFSGLQYTYDPNKAIWLKIPFLNTPVPAYRSVQDAAVYTGHGIQSSEPYSTLNKDSEKLYHLVSDYYLTSFLPMIGDILPKLKLVIKDEQGQPLELEKTIIHHQGHEFKVWEAVARYAMSLEKNDENIPVVPAVYQTTQDRIVAQKGFPLYIVSYTILVVILILIIFLIRWIIIRKRKKSHTKPQHKTKYY